MISFRKLECLCRKFLLVWRLNQTDIQEMSTLSFWHFYFKYYWLNRVILWLNSLNITSWLLMLFSDSHTRPIMKLFPKIVPNPTPKYNPHRKHGKTGKNDIQWSLHVMYYTFRNTSDLITLISCHIQNRIMWSLLPRKQLLKHWHLKQFTDKICLSSKK